LKMGSECDKLDAFMTKTLTSASTKSALTL